MTIRIETYDASIDEMLIGHMTDYIVGIRHELDDDAEECAVGVFKIKGFSWHGDRPCYHVAEVEEAEGYEYVEVGRERFLAIDDHIVTVY